MVLKPFKYVSAASAQDTVSALSGYGDKAKLIAGGTDLLGALKDDIRYPIYPETLINIKTIDELRYIEETQEGLRIGALTKIREIETNEIVRRKYKVLAEAAHSIASPQIRNMGTLGGNICQHPRCWYFRYPGNFFNCIRKGGKICNAMLGENQYHSIFGAARIGTTQCSSNCPGEVDVPSYLAKIRERKLDEAAQILLERNPIPAITGRVCPHFCELTCNRGEFDEPVSVRAIERAMGDYILANSSKIIKPAPKETGKKVAIIGSGPAGLSAGYYLRKMGYGVTVYEKRQEAGGMLAYCIPGNRLSRDVVRQQLEALRGMGVKLKVGIDVGSGVSFDKLRKEYDCIFLATGAWTQKKLGIENEDLLISGLEFLTEVSLGERKPPGVKVLVIGGGNVAVDVAITATRLGAQQVTMVCLESREEMPAFAEDVQAAVEEGVVIMPSWGPHRILESQGRASGVEFVRCTSVFDNEGRFRPTLDRSVRKTIEADSVILAIGQAPDFDYAPQSMSTTSGLMGADARTQATNVAGVFAGGDMATGTASIIEAIAAGRRAAYAINSYLGGDTASGGNLPVEHEALLEFDKKCLDKTERARSSELPRSERGLDKEDVFSLNLAEAGEEATRCLNCGCVAVNASDMAPALIALAAKVRTTKRTVDAENFFDAGVMKSTIIDADELVTEIDIPLKFWSKQVFLKFSTRRSMDFATVNIACVFDLDGNIVNDTRIVLGATSPVPFRTRETEDFLKGKVLTEEIAKAAAALAVKEANPLSKNKYKVKVVSALMKNAILYAADN